LGREALLLTPLGYHDRAGALLFINLESSLYICFTRLRDESLLNEANTLDREALSLMPTGYSNKVLLCGNLATALYACFNHVNDYSHLNEARTHYDEALRILLQIPERWRILLPMSRLHFDHNSSQYNPGSAVDCLQHSISPTAGSLPELLSDCGGLITQINPVIVPEHSRHSLLQCISAAIDLASLVARFTLNHKSQS
jgi:hypothetical protein